MAADKDIREIECDEAIRMVLEFLDNELGQPDHDALEQHISKCRSCYSRVEFEKRLKGLIQYTPDEKASENLKQRVKKITDQF